MFSKTSHYQKFHFPINEVKRIKFMFVYKLIIYKFLIIYIHIRNVIRIFNENCDCKLLHFTFVMISRNQEVLKINDIF